MTNRLLATIIATFSMIVLHAGDNLREDFEYGNPEIQAINAMDFGPEGILFIGDSESGKIFAVDTKDVTVRPEVKDFNIVGLDEKIAGILGTTPDNMTIADLAINPISKSIYVAVAHSNGSSVLIKIDDNETMSVMNLDQVSYSDQLLEKPVETAAKDRRGRSLRKWAISDLNYSNGKLMVTGLSNQEFGSTFRSMSFPFVKKEQMTSLEIYHAAHGRYETNSPIKAFTTASIDEIEYIIASYTCTPLVIFPATDLKSGEHVKGRTVAELGNRNTPLDMIVMEKEGKNYLLMANSSRAVMKISLGDIENFSGSLTEPVAKSPGTGGVEFTALPLVNVLQLDQLDDSRFVMLQRKANGDLQLWTANDRWL